MNFDCAHYGLVNIAPVKNMQKIPCVDENYMGTSLFSHVFMLKISRKTMTISDNSLEIRREAFDVKKVKKLHIFVISHSCNPKELLEM